jgi:hypothetical protein
VLVSRSFGGVNGFSAKASLFARNSTAQLELKTCDIVCNSDGLVRIRRLG